MKPLSDRRQAFVTEYLVDLNATQAALRAGYAPRSARQQASVLMTNPDIKAAIAEYQAQQRTETKADEAYIVAKLMAEVEALNPKSGANRIRALDLLARLGGYPAPERAGGSVPDTHELRMYSIPELLAIVEAFRAGEARALPEPIDVEVEEIDDAEHIGEAPRAAAPETPEEG